MAKLAITLSIMKAAIAILICLSASPCFAQGVTCGELSYQRNAIYKRAGYCFKTSAQIRVFGNSGCLYDEQADVPLSLRDREAIALLVREEQLGGCR